MEFTERKKQILKAIIDDYIETAEPLGSRTIAKRHALTYSPATIRNEMADLEEMGYLDKPHSSAGRVPSYLGYRFYVDMLMQHYRLTLDEMNQLQYKMQRKALEMDSIVKKANELLSGFTSYTTFAVTPVSARVTLKKMKLLLIESCIMMMVLVTDEDVVKNRTVRISPEITQEFLDRVCGILNEHIETNPPERIDLVQIEALAETLRQYPEICLFIQNFIDDSIDRLGGGQVFVDGTSNIFRYPEYKDLDKARTFLDFVDDEENLQRIILKNKEGKTMVVRIGEENEEDAMHDCSLVVSRYSAGGNLEGTIGVIGPTRMDYARAISGLECLTNSLSNIFKELFE